MRQGSELNKNKYLNSVDSWSAMYYFYVSNVTYKNIWDWQRYATIYVRIVNKFDVYQYTIECYVIKLYKQMQP